MLISTRSNLGAAEAGISKKDVDRSTEDYFADEVVGPSTRKNQVSLVSTRSSIVDDEKNRIIEINSGKVDSRNSPDDNEDHSLSSYDLSRPNNHKTYSYTPGLDGTNHSHRSANSLFSSTRMKAGAKRLIHRASVFQKAKLTFKDTSGRALNERSQREILFVIAMGLCLSFNSGFINGLCISGLLSPSGSISQSVAGFTGAYTKSGLALAQGDVSSFGFEVAMIFCFLSGSFISGLINPQAVPHQLEPKYGPTFLIGSTLLFIASTLSCLRPQERELFYFAAAANGLQNGMTSMYTANLIRTTHLTGTTTDIGLFLGQIARGNRRNAWKCCVLIGLAFSFWTGSLISVYAALSFRSLSLFFNACFFLFIALTGFVFISLTQRVKFLQLISGNWQWEAALASFDIKKSNYKDGTLDEKALEIFDRIDYYGKGYIEADELYVALKATGMRVTEQSAKSMLQVVDVDKKGKISREEFLEFIRGKVGKEGTIGKAKRLASDVSDTVSHTSKTVSTTVVKSAVEMKRRISDQLSNRSLDESSSSSKDEDQEDAFHINICRS